MNYHVSLRMPAAVRCSLASSSRSLVARTRRTIAVAKGADVDVLMCSLPLCVDVQFAVVC